MLRHFITAIVVLLSVTGAEAGAGSADSLVTTAWKQWKGHASPIVEKLFREALVVDSCNTRAHLGLAMLYTLQDKHLESWKEYRRVLTTEKNYYPYVFATWLNPRFKIQLDDDRAEILDILKRIAEDPEADESLRAQSCEILGQSYRDQGDLAASGSWFSRMHAILQWTLNGPYDNVSASGFDRAFPPEAEYDTAKTYAGKNDAPAKWFPINVVRPDGWIDHQCYFAYTNAVYYANTFVYSPVKQSVQVRIGTSGSLKAFLNDELLIGYFDENNNDLDTYVVSTELQQGWNRILIKCGYSEISKCNFMVRLTSPDGKPIEQLKISTNPQSYVRMPGAPKHVNVNFAEAFFADRVNRNPDHFENYVLLADCYARNDKAIEAELSLREAIRHLPDCPLFLVSISEAYARGEKYDEMNQVLDKVLEIDPGIPTALGHKLSRVLQNEEYDEAQEVLRQLEEQEPGSEVVYTSRLGYFSKRNQVDKIIELNAEALKKYPGNWDFVYLGAVIAIQTTQKYDGAIELINEFLKRHYTSAALTTLADCYLKSSQIDQWEATFARLQKFDPCTPGWHYKMCEVYMSLREYPKAEQSLLSAIAICPNSSIYWSKLGDVYSAMKDDKKASSAFHIALTFNPADFGARESLREIEGKKSIFARFSSFDVDSIARSAPTAKAYPNDKGVILLDDTKRVVFERGASVSSHELLIKVFTPSGIDDCKEYQIGYNANTEQLIVEKAVSIKKDGSQAKADVNKGYVVFKSLEAGDCIYLKWKIKNFYIGRLSNHFWDTQYFNGFYPIMLGRYALLVPRGRDFHHQTQNMQDNPVIKSTEDGTLYTWTLNDEPAIEYEDDMPGLDDVGKILYISSIPSWDYLVDWYTDLAQTKTRSSFEIKEQIDSLFARKGSLTEEEKIRIIYNFITENIRYSNVSFRQSGLVPQKARDVLVSRIGDCKDVATLCIAMLKQIGIEAHYVLVNTAGDGENRKALPGIIFNHCITAVETQHGLRYLDLTANSYSMGSAPSGDVDAFSLRIAPGAQLPGYISKDRFIPRSIHRVTSVDVGDDNSVTLKRTSTRTGSAAARRRGAFRYKGQTEREKILGESLGNEFPNVKVKSLAFTNLDEPMDTLIDTYEIDVPGYVTESGTFKLLRIPWTDNLTASKALSYEKRNYQFNYWPSADTLVEDIEIRLPKGYVPVDPKRQVSLSSSIASYKCSFRFSKGVLTGRRQFVQLKSAVSPDEYQTFKKFYNSIVKEDNAQVLLKRK